MKQSNVRYEYVLQKSTPRKLETPGILYADITRSEYDRTGLIRSHRISNIRVKKENLTHEECELLYTAFEDGTVYEETTVEDLFERCNMMLNPQRTY